jgi:hypothetical protein
MRGKHVVDKLSPGPAEAAYHNPIATGQTEQQVAVGDLKNGYIVAPVSEPVFRRLRAVAAERGVPIDDLGEPAPCLQQSA